VADRVADKIFAVDRRGSTMRKPGARKKIVAVWVAVLAAVAVAAVLGAAPGAATAAPENAAAPVAALQDPPETGTLSAAGLFTPLAKSAAGEVVNSFVGWGLSAVGVGGPGLADISDQLGQITSQLQAIETTLSGIENDLTLANCITENNQANPAVTAIKAANRQYTNLVNTAAEKPDNPPSASALSGFAEMVLTGESNMNISMGYALASIDTAMRSTTDQGILANCLKNTIVPLPGAGSTNYFGTDGAYYGYLQTRSQATVDDFVGYYYGYETIALMLLVEAYHIEAQQAAEMPTEAYPPPKLSPADVGQLCLNSQIYSGDVGLYCTDAEGYTNQAYEYVEGWFAAAGLPYTDDQVLLWNTGDHPLYVRSLEDFTQAFPHTVPCTVPLTAAEPCGVTTATWATAADPMVVPYDGYLTWQTLNQGQVQNLLGHAGSLPPGQYMNSLGFENAEHKIILTSTRAQFPYVSGTDEMACFFHTDLPRGIYCSAEDALNGLLQGTGVYCGLLGPELVETNSGLPAGDNDFFAAETQCAQAGPSEVWVTQPGWLVGNTGENAVQYRWPLLMTGTLTCTKGADGKTRSQTNPQGVLTRCGADYDALFNRLVPRPVTCAGTTAGECDQQAQVALSGPDVSGKWSAPVSADEVSVTYDGDTARTISGTAELPATDGGSPATVTFKIRRGEGAKGPFYNGTVTIQIDGHQALVVPLRHAELRHFAHRSVSGQVVWPRGNHGTYTLTYAVLDTA
jgi:hypothetical protein